MESDQYNFICIWLCIKKKWCAKFMISLWGYQPMAPWRLTAELEGKLQVLEWALAPPCLVQEGAQ